MITLPVSTLPDRSKSIKLIAELDKVLLSSLRKLWMDAKTLNRPEEVSKWSKRLDSALDERLRHMAIRDAR